MKVIDISLPGYKVNAEPDHSVIGKLVDDVIRQNFMDKSIIACGLTSGKHPNMTLHELIKTISNLGTDRYDPGRIGDRYDNIQGKHINLFGFRRKVTTRMKLFEDISWDFTMGLKPFTSPTFCYN